MKTRANTVVQASSLHSGNAGWKPAPQWIALASATCAPLLIGCSQPAREPQYSAQDKQLFWRPDQSTPAVSHPDSVLLAKGPAPLVYQVQQPGDVTVTDLTSGKQLARASVRPGTIVWVDQDHGVSAGEDHLRPGPLPDGHTYGISVATDTTDSWRTGAGVVRPPRQQAPPPDASQRQE